MSFLRVSGTKIVNEEGTEVVLKGAGLGGWMLMENFISGFPGCEFQIREALADVIGETKAEFFFDKYLEHFFTLSDAQFFKSLGLNCIRIAINYRHFLSDSTSMTPSPKLNANAFTHLDRVINLCSSQHIYTIIDMHSAPGGQSGGWHCDSGSHTPYFFFHKDFQDRLVWIWQRIVDRYKNDPWVAGYNLLNEPADPSPGCHRLINVYDRLVGAVRDIDQRHIVFLDGNTFATDFTFFPDDASSRWENSAYSIHDYAVYGFPSSPELYVGSEEQRERLRRTYGRKRMWMDQRGFCVWNGEWGPVYPRAEFDYNKPGDPEDEMEKINEARLKVVKDQLDIYTKDKLSWSIWLYKDIGFQGMVYVSPDTPYMRRFKQFLARKHRLAIDAWGKDDTQVKHIYQPIIDLVRSSLPSSGGSSVDPKLYPPLWSIEERVTRISRTILVAEFLVREWADLFEGLDEPQLEELARSFRFENCVEREGLNRVLREYA